MNDEMLMEQEVAVVDERGNMENLTAEQKSP